MCHDEAKTSQPQDPATPKARMYKRPNPRPTSNLKTKFVSEVGPGGAIIGRHVTWAPSPRVWTGAPGLVGDIVRTMHRGYQPTRPPPTPWRPPYDAEFTARHMPDPEAYMKRVEQFYKENPPPERKVKPPPPNYNFEPIHKVIQKHTPVRPPIGEWLAALKEAGYSEEKLEKVLRWHEHMEATSDERQAKLDAIFAKWPSSSKAAPKPKPAKPIKAVKKKMPIL